ncbi:prepilin peptidase [Leifsonia sp. NPDC058194]|uniref:prepilin peptidase n=1 Tax=Leifsonia sp. NPDC058194 TaxID=3346374 RepID=UPI0036D8A2D6
MGGSTGIRILIAVGLATALVGVRGVGPAAVAACYVAAVTAPLIVADAREQRLPNALVLPGYAFAAVGLVWEALARGSPGVERGGLAAVTVIGCAGGVFAVLAMMSRAGALGMGDAKLAGLLALAIGPALPLVVWLSSAFTAAAMHTAMELAVLGRNRDPVRREVAFGPALLASFWVTVLTI